MVPTRQQHYSQGSDYHVETTEFDAIGQHVKKGNVAPWTEGCDGIT